MDTLKERLRAARLKAGLSQERLAQLAGCSQGTIGQLENGSSSATKFLVAIARVLGVSPGFLETGKEPSVENVAETGVYGAVPLISWVQAGMWADIVDNYMPGSAEDLRPAYTSKPGSQSFALRVEGDSMVSHNHTSFPEGTILIVDPARHPSTGDYVIAKDIETQKATFKRLMQDGGRWFLKPLNPAYPILAIDDPAIRVIGVVIESQSINKL